MAILVIILGIVSILVVSMLFENLSSGSFTCPRCKQEIINTEKWSYGDYLWGERCPHCKYEFDITP